MWSSYHGKRGGEGLLTGGVAAAEERIKSPKTKTRVVRTVDL